MLRRAAAVLLLVFLASAAALPAAVTGGRRSGCHCPVRMACCEDGTCTMTQGDEPPSDGPEWRSCRRGGADDAVPLGAFERALKRDAIEAGDRPAAARLADLAAARPHAGAHETETPPPRSFSF